MKKQLLLGALFLGALFTAQAQGDSCAAAEYITPDVYTVGSWPGAAPTQCYGSTTTDGGAPLMGAWYKYTPAENGYVTLTSVLTQNPAGTTATSIDTRLSVYTGTCDALTCYAGSDDVANADWRSEATFAVAANTTYYVVWENYWQALEFDFELSFEAADCFYPNDISLETSAITNTSFTLSWDPAIGTPGGYEVLYGATGFDPETEGETLTTTGTSVNITGQENGSGVDFYIRSQCGEGVYSEWSGPFYQLLPTTLPYENNFDADGDIPADLAGFNVNGFGYSTDTNEGLDPGTLSDTPEGFFFSRTATSGTTDSRLFIRPIYLAAGEQVTFYFSAAYLSSSGSATFEVTVGTSRLVADQTVIGTPFTLDNAGGGIEYNEFVTDEYTAPAAGTYYLTVHNTSAAQAEAFLLFDTIAITSELGTKTLAGNKLSVYPNPTTDVVNVANAGLINSVKVTDLNGRIVKATAFDGVDAAQVSIADLASGVYLMTVASDKGTNTTKIVKN
ncbi:T9SS type A sorting domain-containing protein [Flavobacterium sp. RHBU_24]|uniref:T9SS type A sorting domain-containing protein n=1 Tax=Flavobacterium sp. RHBU_24 TaxID=3391185 RepID=UPI0039847845